MNDKMLLKKRRNVKSFGCIREMSGGYSNMKLETVKRGDICSSKSERVALNEPQEMAKNCDGVWG